MIKPRRRKTWRCFFCDEVFRSRRAAWLHFGDEGCVQDPPACIDPLRRDEKERIRELREARKWAIERDRRATEVEEQLDQANVELGEFKSLTKCQTVHQLRMALDYAEGELLTARKLIEGVIEKAPAVYEELIYANGIGTASGLRG
jgi:hypothetical protein